MAKAKPPRRNPRASRAANIKRLNKAEKLSSASKLKPTKAQQNETARSNAIVNARLAMQTLQARINSLAYAAPEAWGHHLELVARALDNIGGALGLLKGGKPLPVPPKSKKTTVPARRQALLQELCTVINSHNVENDSNTPDLILAAYLVRCLDLFAEASREREKWYGKSLELGK